jgi:hypothetical protein
LQRRLNVREEGREGRKGREGRREERVFIEFDMP